MDVAVTSGRMVREGVLNFNSEISLSWGGVRAMRCIIAVLIRVLLLYTVGGIVVQTMQR